VSDRPADAVAVLGEKYPGDPVKVATIIESCVATTGPLCERVAALVQAIPSMMSAAAPSGDVATVCAGMPAAMQWCLLPSYALAQEAHPEVKRATIGTRLSISVRDQTFFALPLVK
jgi:hypothetical protein